MEVDPAAERAAGLLADGRSPAPGYVGEEYVRADLARTQCLMGVGAALAGPEAKAALDRQEQALYAASRMVGTDFADHVRRIVGAYLAKLAQLESAAGATTEGEQHDA